MWILSALLRYVSFPFPESSLGKIRQLTGLNISAREHDWQLSRLVVYTVNYSPWMSPTAHCKTQMTPEYQCYRLKNSSKVFSRFQQRVVSSALNHLVGIVSLSTSAYIIRRGQLVLLWIVPWLQSVCVTAHTDGQGREGITSLPEDLRFSQQGRSTRHRASCQLQRLRNGGSSIASHLCSGISDSDRCFSQKSTPEISFCKYWCYMLLVFGLHPG